MGGAPCEYLVAPGISRYEKRKCTPRDARRRGFPAPKPTMTTIG
ncbi:hypothetical protein [Pontibacter sp. BT310]|nr:hypothetical protein [Pontibacter sp. BT310]